jgi:polysaccharide biosynthesis transport protein
VDLRDYLRILRARWRLILLCTLLAIGAAALATFAATPVYRAQAQLFVSTSQGDAGSVGGLQQGSQFAQQRVKSYAEVIDNPTVTQAVIDELGLDLTARELESRIEATAPLDTVLINVDVTDESPSQAKEIADAVATRFTQVASELETPDGGTSSPVKVSVVRAADVPEVPVSPRPLLNLALGLLVGVAVGVGAAVLRETLDTSIKGVEDVQDGLGLAPLGIIGYDGDSAKRPLIVHLDPQSVRAEAFRQLRTNLQFVNVGGPPRSIVITSSVPGEGKTTTTCNLAIALAQAGVRVVLVEGDLRRPRVAEYMGLEGAIGLTDVLIGRASLQDVAQPWGTGSLRVLASGPNPPNPSELLGSAEMQAVLVELEGLCDLVLIDAPPLLPVTDAAILAKQASGAILVVRAGHTTKEQSARALSILNGVDAHVYGAVLNMVPTKGPGAYAYGYYGYGYRAPETGREPVDRSSHVLAGQGPELQGRRRRS